MNASYSNESGFASNLLTLILLAIISWTTYFLFISPGALKEILFKSKPCSQPIRYSLGSIDPRFGLTTSTVLDYLEQSSALWSDAVSSTLFAYDPNGSLKINFIYDQRQSSTDQLRELGYRISNDKASYDELYTKYQTLKTELDSKKRIIDTRTLDLTKRSDAYQAEVEEWNTKGGAPQDVYRRLNKEQSELKRLADQLEKLIDEYNGLTEQVNSVGVVLNRVADSLNLKADLANEVSDRIQGEFQEGEYRVDASGKQITIYEFDSTDRLIRVLAHEFGHALDIEHVNDPEAIMYYLNKDIEASLTQDDLSAIKTICHAL